MTAPQNGATTHKTPRQKQRDRKRKLISDREGLSKQASIDPTDADRVRQNAVLENSAWLRVLSWYQIVGVWAVAVAFWILDRRSADRWLGTHWAVFDATIFTAIILTVLIANRWTRGGLLDYIRGQDNRLSTSQAQAAMWTIVVTWTVLYFAVRRLTDLSYADFTTAFGNLDSNYLILLGGPFAAAVLSKLSTQSKTNDGTSQKSDAAGPQLRDLTNNDNGNPDLVDTQFMVFNLVAVFVFGVLLKTHPDQMPSLPSTLIGLTSVSALTYVSTKAVTTNPPTILGVVEATPQRDTSMWSGTTVEIRGVNFTPAGSNDAELKAKIRVMFGTLTAYVDLTKVSDTSITAVVPELDPKTRSVDVTVTTAAGVTTPKYDLAVAPTPEKTSKAKTGNGRTAMWVRWRPTHV